MKQSLRRAPVLAAVVAALAVAAPASAGAATANQLVSGTTGGLLALTGGAAIATGVTLTPGATTMTSGVLSLGITLSRWTLTVQDNATGSRGHMVAAASGCTGGEASLTNPLSVSIGGLLGVTPGPPVSISGAAQQVASGTALGALVLTANYSQAVNADEALLSGCVYSLTSTYTLAGS